MFSELLKRAQERLVEKTRNRPINDIMVTEVAKCLRQSYYHRVEPTFILTDKIVWGQEGHRYAEAVLQEVFQEVGYICAPEVKYSVAAPGSAVKIGGVADLVCGSEAGDMVVVEVKVTSNPGPENIYWPWYERQVRCYMSAILQSHPSVKSVTGIVLLLSPDFSRAYWRFYSEPLGDCYSRAVKLYTALVEGREPEREDGPWCRFCPYKTKCLNVPLI